MLGAINNPKYRLRGNPLLPNSTPPPYTSIARNENLRLSLSFKHLMLVRANVLLAGHAMETGRAALIGWRRMKDILVFVLG